MGIAHLALDFCTRNESSNGVDNDNINRTAAYQSISNLQRLLAIIRLRNQQIVNINAQMARIFRIQCVLRINEGCIAAQLLRLSNHMQSHSRLTGRFRSINFNHTSTGNTADTKSNIQR